MITGMDKPFCKHRRWPCRECGTTHYDGCECSVCRPPAITFERYAPERETTERKPEQPAGGG